MRDGYQQSRVRLLIRPLIDLQYKHVGKLISSEPSHAARKDFTRAEETVVGRGW